MLGRELVGNGEAQGLQSSAFPRGASGPNSARSILPGFHAPPSGSAQWICFCLHLCGPLTVPLPLRAGGEQDEGGLSGCVPSLAPPTKAKDGAPVCRHPIHWPGVIGQLGTGTFPHDLHPLRPLPLPWPLAWLQRQLPQWFREPTSQTALSVCSGSLSLPSVFPR